MNQIEKSDGMYVRFFSLRGAPVRQRRAGSASKPFRLLREAQKRVD
jgi:hypothetical protein